MRLRDWLTFAPAVWKCLGRLPLGHLFYLSRQLRFENPHRHRDRLHLNSFFPPYPSPAFDRFLDAAIARRRLPYSVYYAVTDQCPFHCPHCSYGRRQLGRPSTPQALAVIEQIKSLGAITIGFTGGEPLLREDIVELVRAVGDDTASVLFTTGFGMDRPRANALADAGLDCLMIGLESDDPVVHDHIRGVSGSFEQSLGAIKISLAAGLYTAISTVGTREKINSGQIQRLAELAQRYGVHEFRILEPVPTGSFQNRTDAILTTEESHKLTDFHRRWNRHHRGPAIAAFSHLESDAMFGCGAGFHHLFIDATGNVCPCDLTPLSFGNVFEEPLENIWKDMATFFGLPRCGCLMKDLCRRLDMFQGEQLPLTSQVSSELCRQIPSNERLPGIYARLFKGHTPTNPPANRL